MAHAARYTLICALAKREAIDGASLVNQDHPQVIEIWNLVFMGVSPQADGSLESLPEKHVDTGMGFERLVRAIEGKSSNYDTAVFSSLLKKIEAITSQSYGKVEGVDIAMRVIADHLRAVSLRLLMAKIHQTSRQATLYDEFYGALCDTAIKD